MQNWIAELYEAGLKERVSKDVIETIEKLPDLFGNNLTILHRYGFLNREIYSNSSPFYVSIIYTNERLERDLKIFLPGLNYEQVGIYVGDKGKCGYREAQLHKYFIKKSNGRVSNNDFNLLHYNGTLEEKVSQFCSFLQAQFEIRGLFWLDGTSWLDGYGLDWHANG